MKGFIQFMIQVVVSTGCTVTYYEYGNFYTAQSHYWSEAGHTQPQCEARCTADRKCAGYSYNKETSQCSISERADPQNVNHCSSCIFANKKCTSECVITYHYHGTFHKTNSWYKSYSDYSKTECETKCTEDSSCAGFGYNGGTRSCYKSARSDPQDISSCSACTFYTKQCTTVMDTTTTVKPTTTTSLTSTTEGVPFITSVSAAEVTVNTMRGDPMSTSDWHKSATTIIPPTTTIQSASTTQAGEVNTKETVTAVTDEALPKVSTTDTETDEASPKVSTTETVVTVIDESPPEVNTAETVATVEDEVSTTEAVTDESPPEVSTTETVATVEDEVSTTETVVTVTDESPPEVNTAETVATVEDEVSTTEAVTDELPPEVSTTETVATVEDESRSTLEESKTVTTVFKSTTTTSTGGLTTIQYTSTTQAQADVNKTETVMADDSSSTAKEYKTVTNTTLPSSSASSEIPPTTNINKDFGTSIVTCTCTCSEVNITIQEQIWQRKNALQIKVEKLSSTKRKHYSASDPRPSSKTIGALGVVILALIGSLIVIPDILNLAQWITKSTKDL